MVQNDYEMGESDRVTQNRARNIYYDRLYSSRGGFAGLVLYLGTLGGSFIYLTRKFKNVNNKFVSIPAAVFISTQLGHIMWDWSVLNLGEISEEKYLNPNLANTMNDLNKKDIENTLNRY